MRHIGWDAGYYHGRNGVTLVEAAIAMGVLTLLCGSILLVGIQARRTAESSRVAIEARALGKQRLEEMMAVGIVGLRHPTCVLLNTDTNRSSLGATIIRRPRVIWHAANKTLTSAVDAAYAEVHVDVVFPSLIAGGLRTNVFSTVIQ